MAYRLGSSICRLKIAALDGYERASDPSPVRRRLMTAPSPDTLSPRERAVSSGGRGWRERAVRWHVCAPLILKRRIHTDDKRRDVCAPAIFMSWVLGSVGQLRSGARQHWRRLSPEPQMQGSSLPIPRSLQSARSNDLDLARQKAVVSSELREFPHTAGVGVANGLAVRSDESLSRAFCRIANGIFLLKPASIDALNSAPPSPRSLS